MPKKRFCDKTIRKNDWLKIFTPLDFFVEKVVEIESCTKFLDVYRLEYFMCVNKSILSINLCFLIAEKAKYFIDNESGKALIELAIEKSRKCLNGNCDVSEELYTCMENFTLFRERETSEIVIAAWDSIIDAIAFICKSACLTNGAKYFPEPIESVHSGTIDHMLQSFLCCSEQDLEISIYGEKILRLWTTTGCAEMNEAYHIQKYIPNAWAIGDDEGGNAIIYVKENNDIKLYAVSFSNIDDDDKVYIAPSLGDFFNDNIGVNIFLSL